MRNLSVALLALLALAYGDFIAPGVRTSPNRQIDHHFPGLSSILFPDDRRSNRMPVFEPEDPAEGADGVLDLPEDLDLNAMDLNGLSLVNSIDNITDFADLFGLALPKDEEPGKNFGDNIARSGNVRGVAEKAEMARCKPELQTVELDLPVEHNTLFYPTCVRLEQCGGCCYGPLLTCRPKVSKVVNLKVMKIAMSSSSSSSRNGGTVERSVNNRRRQRGRGRRGRRRRESVSSYFEVQAIKHVECECGCKVQKQDCNPAIHNYMEEECTCECKRRDEKQKCKQQHSIKYWDKNSCGCYCRRELDCSTGEYFSQQSCKCEIEVSRSAFTD